MTQAEDDGRKAFLEIAKVISELPMPEPLDNRLHVIVVLTKFMLCHVMRSAFNDCARMHEFCATAFRTCAAFGGGAAESLYVRSELTALMELADRMGDQDDSTK